MSTSAASAEQVRVQFEQDVSPLNSIVRRRDIYEATAEDGSPDPLDLDLAELSGNPSVRFVGAYAGEELAGFFLLTQMGSVLWQFHTAILPEHRGATAVVAAQRMLLLAFAQLGAEQIITFVPKFNRVASMYAGQIGLQRYGTVPQSFLKSGVAHDQILYGISRRQPCL